MLNLLKYANGIYNLYRYDIGCDLSISEFYKLKFISDHMKMNQFCSIIYKKLF